MSYFSFLTMPNKLGVTSCIRGDYEDLPILTNDDILDYCSKLADRNVTIINQQVAKGRIVIIGRVEAMNDYQKVYPINDQWQLESHRANKKTWLFLLQPTHISSTYHYKIGMKKIAKTFLNNAIDVDLWVRYNKQSKIFYLEEFAKVIDQPKQITAIMKYTELFSVSDLRDWVDTYEWQYPDMNYTHRLYLKRHVTQHLKSLKKQSK